MSLVSAIVNDPTLQLIALVAVVAALADLAVSVTAAIARHGFDVNVLADFLATHVLARVIPIVSLAGLAAALSHGTAGMDNVPGALTALIGTTWAASLAGVVAYAAETFASLQQSIKPVQGE
mgnify:CR=1 FL=1